MKIDTYASYHHVLPKDIKDRNVIVIDTLRATSSMITALGNGCKEVIPAAEIDEAVAVARNIGGKDVLLTGERDTNLIPGFDMGNSPLEYTRKKVEGKVIVMTTTNGTEAMLRTKGAKKVFLGAFLNDKAVSKMVAREHETDCTILCAGTHKRLSLEDILTAGAIISEIKALLPCGPLEIDDLGQMAYEMFTLHKQDLTAALQNCSHCKRLIANGHKEDIDYCCRRNTETVVPVFADGTVTLSDPEE